LPDDADHLGVEFFSKEKTRIKKSRFTEERIITILGQADAGVEVAELAANMA